MFTALNCERTRLKHMFNVARKGLLHLVVSQKCVAGVDRYADFVPSNAKLGHYARVSPVPAKNVWGLSRNL